MRKISALIAFFLVFTAGCSWFQAKETEVKSALIDCAKQDLGQTVAQAGESLLLTVVGIIFQGGADWRADLSALEAKYGPEAVACAANVAAVLFKAPPAEGSAMSATQSPYDRAAGLISTRGWQFR